MHPLASRRNDKLAAMSHNVRPASREKSSPPGQCNRKNELSGDSGEISLALPSQMVIISILNN
jgi:hypothetical protein